MDGQMIISELLLKTKHYDKDERYMATSDLCELLKRQSEYISSHSSSSNNNNNNNNNDASTTGNTGTGTCRGGSRGNSTSNSSSSNNRNNGNGTIVLMDTVTERQVCTAVLQLLHDNSNDVQAIAVKTLSVLITTVHADQIAEITNSLLKCIIDNNQSKLRDVFTIGLKTLVKTISYNIGNTIVCDHLVRPLLDGIRTNSGTGISSSTSTATNTENQDIVLSSLDVLTDLISRFGSTSVTAQRHHEQILQICIQLLQSQQSSTIASTEGATTGSTSTATTSTNAHMIRKRAGNTLGVLSIVLSDTLLQRLIESILQLIEQFTSSSSSSSSNNNSNNTNDLRALIRTLCTIAGSVGQRLGKVQIDRIIPILIRFTNPAEAITNDDDDDDDEDNEDAAIPIVTLSEKFINSGMSEEGAIQLANEIRESCFVGYEAFLLRCPNDVEDHLPNIIQASLAFMSYDPNYSYGPDDDDDDNNDSTKKKGKNNNNDDDEENEYDDDNNDEYDNNEDEFDDDDDDQDDDDDDESWKVRRSAIRVLLSIIEAKRYNPTIPLWKTLWNVTTSSTTTNNNKKSTTIANALISRFKEREENCRVSVIECFNHLIDVTIQANRTGIVQFVSTTSTGSSNNDNNNTNNMEIDDNDTDTESTMTINFHTDYSNKVVKACDKILNIKKGNERSKSSILSLLSKLCQTPGGIVDNEQITLVFNHIKSFLSSSSLSDTKTTSNNNSAMGTSSKALRLDAIQLVHAILVYSYTNNTEQIIRNNLYSILLPELCLAVQEQWYKVIAEALRTLAEIPRFFTITTVNDNDAQQQQQQNVKECTDVATQLFIAIEPLLSRHDVDQEIKECALKACSTLMSSLHIYLTTDQSNRLLLLLLDRLKNETTRIIAIRTISSIASTSTSSANNSTTNTNTNNILQPIFAESISTMSSFLKLANRSLQQSSLEAINKIINTTSNINSADDSNQQEQQQQLYSTVLKEVASLISDKDMHLTYLSLKVSVSILSLCLTSGTAIRDYILEPTLVLSSSSNLPDNSLDSVLSLLKGLVQSNTMTFQDLLHKLLVRVPETMTKHGVYNLSKCIAVITTTASVTDRSQYMKETFTSLRDNPASTSITELRTIQLSILITGDVGRMIDLSTVMSVNETVQLKEIYLQYFDSTADELKHAASYALGNASIGAPTIFLDAIVTKLLSDNETKHLFLVLGALREFIQCTAKKNLVKESNTVNEDDVTKHSLQTIIPSLEKHCSAEEDGVRTMVAECFGSLVCLQPDIMLPKLEQILKVASTAITTNEKGYIDDDDDITSKMNVRICCTVLTSIKVAVAGKVNAIIMAKHMSNFITLLSKPEIQCRNATLLMIYSAVHHSPETISSIMRELIIPTLYTISELKLVRQVDLGPFKHTIDDALTLRKSALSIFATCLENTPNSIDIQSFMPIIAIALNDVEDIQLHAHQIVISMCHRQASYVVAAADTFVDPLEKTINKKQGTKTGTELERFNDWMKSTLRVMLSISRLDGIMNNNTSGNTIDGSNGTTTVGTTGRFAEFVERVRNNSKYTPFLQALEAEQ